MSDDPWARGGTTDVLVEHPRRLLVSSWLVLAVLCLATFAGPINTFVEAQWHYSYELGLIPRGLWGTVLDHLGTASLHSIHFASTLLYLATAAGLVAVLVACAADRHRVDPMRATLATTLLASAAGFPMLASQLARFDTPNLLLATIAVALVGRRPTALAAVTASLLLGTSVLSHEAAIVTTVPWTLAWIHGKVRRQAGRFAATVTSAASTSVVVAFFLALSPPDMPRAAFAAWLSARVGRQLTVLHFDVVVPYQTVSEGFDVASAHLATADGQAFLAIAVLQVFPLFATCALALKDGGIGVRHLATDERVLYLLAVLPIALSAVTLDFGRWWGMSGMLVTATTLHVLHQRGRRVLVSRHVGGLAVLSVLAVIAGTAAERTVTALS